MVAPTNGHFQGSLRWVRPFRVSMTLTPKILNPLQFFIPSLQVSGLASILVLPAAPQEVAWGAALPVVLQQKLVPEALEYFAETQGVDVSTVLEDVAAETLAGLKRSRQSKSCPE